MRLRDYRNNLRLIEIEQGERVARESDFQYFNGLDFWLHNNLHFVRSMTKRSGEIFGWACSCGWAQKS